MKQFYFYMIGLLLLQISCGISEDCFKGNGDRVVHYFPYEAFSKVKVYDGVSLIIKEGPDYEVKVETNTTILKSLDVKLNGDMLVVKDNSKCNIARDYGQTIVYLTTPNLTEIHSKTEQSIKSDGVLHFPELKLFSSDENDGAGTGDFYLNLFTNNLYVESNTSSNFFIKGRAINLNVYFSWGNGIFKADDFEVTNLINIIHRGSNDITIFPVYDLSGDIYATGNVILKNKPTNSNTLTAHFTGIIINNYD